MHYVTSLQMTWSKLLSIAPPQTYFPPYDLFFFGFYKEIIVKNPIK